MANEVSIFPVIKTQTAATKKLQTKIKLRNTLNIEFSSNIQKLQKVDF